MIGQHRDHRSASGVNQSLRGPGRISRVTVSPGAGGAKPGVAGGVLSPATQPMATPSPRSTGAGPMPESVSLAALPRTGVATNPPFAAR